ncbi:MAG: Curli production assembly/transport component CsgG [Aquaticitalea sp.]
MIAKSYKNILFFLIVMIHLGLFAQNTTDSLITTKTKFYQLRGNNTVDFGVGTSVMNGDHVDPEFEIYFHVGYKRYLSPYLNVNFSYNKFNLAYVDVFNEGFMSFDLNLESTLVPHSKFSPFLFAGGGYNASNYFDQTAIKFQGGGGIEYIVSDGIGLKFYTNYNHVMSDELDGLIAGASDDTYWRIGFGLNYYFRGRDTKHKIGRGEKSIIESNQIEPKSLP